MSYLFSWNWHNLLFTISRNSNSYVKGKIQLLTLLARLPRRKIFNTLLCWVGSIWIDNFTSQISSEKKKSLKPLNKKYCLQSILQQYLQHLWKYSEHQAPQQCNRKVVGTWENFNLLKFFKKKIIWFMNTCKVLRFFVWQNLFEKLNYFLQYSELETWIVLHIVTAENTVLNIVLKLQEIPDFPHKLKRKNPTSS